MDDCIFCKIANKEIPSNIVYEDDMVIAFNDLNPVAPVHILVVPKKHMTDILNVEKEDMKYIEAVVEAIQKITKEKGIAESGFRIVNNCGEDGGQTVKHIHFHIIGGEKLGGMA
ncbi:MAG: histidine triad nucleotide-binding protein [Clostridia bacterium]|nr:histidine triad nucleotide-binding protein [Clostridia bacterium]